MAINLQKNEEEIIRKKHNAIKMTSAKIPHYLNAIDFTSYK